MRVKLVRHAFPDRPDWLVMEESVPLGTEYEVLGYTSNMIIGRLDTGEERKVNCYLLEGNGSTGYVPTEVVERING